MFIRSVNFIIFISFYDRSIIFVLCLNSVFEAVIVIPVPVPPPPLPDTPYDPPYDSSFMKHLND